jgi:glutamate carboxypeptidase
MSLIERRKQSLLDDLRLHVALPTGARNTPALDESRERLTTRAAALGARLELVRGQPRPGWLYGEQPGQTPLPTAVCRRVSATTHASREFLITGHLDTVHDPRSSFRELMLSSDGQRASGPGCVDMKGGLVIAIAALEALEEAGEQVNWTLLLNSDEETGSFHSAQAIHNEAKRVAVTGGLGIALEPAATGGALVVERAGSGQFMIECLGKAAHVGRDFKSGVSAVTALARVITEVSAISSPDDGLIVNIGPIEGGSATNVVPDRARAWGNVRIGASSQQQEIETELMRFSTEGCPGKSATVRTHLAFSRPSKPLTADVQNFADLCRTCAKGLKQQLPFAKTAGVCDGNNMQAAGLTTLDTLGVRGGGLHTPEEWIEIPSLVERCQLLALIMMRASHI